MKYIIIAIQFVFLANTACSQDYLSQAREYNKFVNNAYIAQMNPAKFNQIKGELMNSLNSKDPNEIEMALRVAVIHGEFDIIKNLPEGHGVSYSRYLVTNLKKALANGDENFDESLLALIKKEDIHYIGGWSHEASQSDMMIRILLARQVNANRNRSALNFVIPDDYLSDEYKQTISYSKLSSAEAIEDIVEKLANKQLDLEEQLNLQKIFLTYPDGAKLLVNQLKKNSKYNLSDYLSLLHQADRSMFTKGDSKWLINSLQNVTDINNKEMVEILISKLSSIK